MRTLARYLGSEKRRIGVGEGVLGQWFLAGRALRVLGSSWKGQTNPYSHQAHICRICLGYVYISLF